MEPWTSAMMAPVEMAPVETGRFPSAMTAMQRMGSLAFVVSLSQHTRQHPYSLIEVLSRMIYGSNMIAFAGGSLQTTYRLCSAVFNEKSYFPQEITQTDFEYQEIRKHLEFRKMSTSPESVLQSYRETLQLAQAAKYLIQKTVLDGRDFDEAILKEAHGILTHKIDLEPEMPWTLYSGKYREWDLPNDKRFLNAAKITPAMQSMIDDLRSEMDHRKMPPLTKDGVYEWICRATRFCQRFILIRPFLNGNGRMYRLLLTMLLLRRGICPAVYGLYAYDRYKLTRVEDTCFEGTDPDLLEVIPKVNNPHLAKFVLDHTHAEWMTLDYDMRAFLRVMCLE